MKLSLFKTLWGFTGDLKLAATQAMEAGMQGIEGPAPADKKEQQAFKQLLDDKGLNYIAEITTAGTYVPDRFATLDEHLQSLQTKLDASMNMNPLFITCLGGCDAWPENQSIEFFQRAMEIANSYSAIISFETHRSRSMFNPWVTQRIVEQLPEIKLTVDFSHWCVVCERLMDTELDVINFIANNTQHIHARVGYDQGPQVPDPRAPEYEYALRAHQGWWEIIWQSQINRGFTTTTMTPEFGPDGYLHELPFSKQPVADLWEVNCWMGQEELRHFRSLGTDLFSSSQRI